MSDRGAREITAVDSHTGGEPTRVIVSGGPRFVSKSLAEKRLELDRIHRGFRTACIREPRGSEVLVGALLVPTSRPDCVAATIFFNNVGVLSMCGHATIGLVVTLAHLGRLGPGKHQVETPAGVVPLTLHEDRCRVTIENVPSYRFAAAVPLNVPGHGVVVGDIAWGGNWFFLTDGPSPIFRMEDLDEWLALAKAIKQSLKDQGVVGRDGAEIDHVELSGASTSADGQGFVLCPGGEWDRSPCGTGTSAKIACLAADQQLVPGGTWIQEGPLGTKFTASYRRGSDEKVIPIIEGKAWVTSELKLLFHDSDPFVDGIPMWIPDRHDGDIG